VLDVEVKNQVLHLVVQRLGQARPGKLEICRQRDRRTPTTKRAARLAYQRSLQGTLERRFSAYQASRLSSSIDLERSFGPIYVRGLLRRGQSGFAVLGVNPQETQSSIDAALTFAILWLDVCREAQAGKFVIEGLKLYSQVPAFSASDRAMIDLLTSTREGRLAVVELKTDEDTHLPLQGLDYWSRLAWHHSRGEFQRFEYFSGRELSPESHDYFWWRRRCICTRRLTSCCNTCRRRLSGPWSGLMNAGGMGCGWYFERSQGRVHCGEA
jgi:hypothetical protein